MLLSHAVLLAEARSYVAGLADQASSFDTAMEYERVLLQLDWLHGGTVPPVTVVPSGDRDVLHGAARTAIRDLSAHPVDSLGLEICAAMLEAAWQLDRGPDQPA